jgi:hypothetical protein
MNMFRYSQVEALIAWLPEALDTLKSAVPGRIR